MAAHLWVLPWLALIAGGATLLAALLRTVRGKGATDSAVRHEPSSMPVRFAAVVIWFVLIAVGTLVELRLGTLQAVDYIGARGLLLGSVAGALLVVLSRSSSSTPLVTFGVAITEMAVARLWLTHGEMTGLTATAIGTLLAVICLTSPARTTGSDDANATRGIDPSPPAPLPSRERGAREYRTAAAGALLSATLAAAMELGFSRATQITEQYWPDIPLLLASATALGLLIGSAIAGPASSGRLRRAVAGGFPVAALLLAALWISSRLTTDATPIKLIACGLVAFAILWGLQRYFAGPGAATDEPAATGVPRSGAADALGVILIFAAIVVAYTYWAGYGIALLLLAGWCVFGSAQTASFFTGDALLGPLAIGLLVAVHRALTLQNSDLLDDTRITDTWSLLALAVGVVLPAAALSEPLTLDGRARQHWAAPLKSMAILVGPVLLIGFLFATQSTDAIVLGAALSVAALAAIRKTGPSVITNAAFLGFFLLQMMPAMALWKEPPRHVKVEVLAAIALAAIIIAMMPRQIEEIEVRS